MPPSVICGFTRSITPTSRRSMVWNGCTVDDDPVVAYWPGHERHVLADDDARFLVVERQQRGRGQDVGAGLRLQRAGEETRGW